ERASSRRCPDVCGEGADLTRGANAAPIGETAAGALERGCVVSEVTNREHEWSGFEGQRQPAQRQERGNDCRTSRSAILQCNRRRNRKRRMSDRHWWIERSAPK